MVASVDATALRWGWISSRRAGMPLMPPWRGLRAGGNASAGRESGRWWFMLIRSKNGNTTAIDFREMAPPKRPAICSLMIRVTRTAKNPHFASGFWYARYGSRFLAGVDKYGTMPLNKVVQPAFKLARMVLSLMTRWLTISKPTVAKFAESRKQQGYLLERGRAAEKGDKLVQANLAKSLEMIAENGRTNSTKAQ